MLHFSHEHFKIILFSCANVLLVSINKFIKGLEEFAFVTM